MLSERQLRRRAHAKGLVLRKYPERSCWFGEYGPYALADLSTSFLVAWGMELEDVQEELK